MTETVSSPTEFYGTFVACYTNQNTDKRECQVRTCKFSMEEKNPRWRLIANNETICTEFDFIPEHISVTSLLPHHNPKNT